MHDAPLPGSLEYWAHRTPGAQAVIDRDRRLTYRSLNEAADRFADGLAQMGIGEGDRVGLRFRLKVEWFVAYWALGKLGASGVAVNWRLTPGECEYIVRDSECRGLVCDDADVSGWVALPLEFLVTVGQDAKAPGRRMEDLLDTTPPVERYGVMRTNLVIYTSGTTGLPKGVESFRAPGDLDPPDVASSPVGADGRATDAPTALMTLPVHHAAGPAAAAACIQSGGTLILLDPYDAASALRLIEEHAVDTWTSVPTMLLRMRALPPEVVSGYDVSSISRLSVGAAAVPFEVKQWAISVFGDDVLHEGYGSTETGMITHMGPEDQARKPGSSGLPYPYVTVRIVDEDWNEVPTGQTGEITVHSPLMRTEYLGQGPMGPDLLSPEGFYRTGDVGHVDEDGYLFITDRIKDMIVAGGTNIYPAEIEAALVQHPDVVDAAVIGIPEDNFGEQVMAFVITGTQRPSDAELAGFLEGRIAKHKLPRRFEYVDEFPLNPMGKVQKNELRAPYWEGRERKV